MENPVYKASRQKEGDNPPRNRQTGNQTSIDVSREVADRQSDIGGEAGHWQFDGFSANVCIDAAIINQFVQEARWETSITTMPFLATSAG